MKRSRVIAVELDRRGHMLLAHEYAHADGEGLRLCFVRRNLFYLNDRFHDCNISLPRQE